MHTLSNNKVSILSGFLLNLAGGGGYSEFQVTGIIKGFFGFKIFDSRIFLGRKIIILLYRYFFGWLDGIFWVFKII